MEFKPQDAETFTNTGISYVINKLWDNTKLREKVLKDLHCIENSKCFSFIIINSIKALTDKTRQHLAVSAKEEKELNRQLRKAWGTNNTLQENTQRTIEEIRVQRENLGREVENKTLIVNEYRSRIKALRANLQTELIAKVFESEREMSLGRSDSAYIQIELAEKAKETTRQFETMQRKHIFKESSLKTKRLKVETQLVGWLTKYDTDVAERQENMEKLTMTFDKALVDFNDLTRMFNEQEEDYNEFMAEKKEEDVVIFEATLYAFLCRRSAKIIQRGWRAYRKRKMEKKMNKGK